MSPSAVSQSVRERVGQLADSSWVARRLCDFEIILCASADYLARHGTPTAPQDLPSHQWLTSEREPPSPRSQAKTTLVELQSSEGERHRLEVEARIVSNNQVAVQHLCEHGLGLARVVHADVQPALERGALVRVLPEFRFGQLPVWAVTPKLEEAEAAKVRAAVDYLKRHFAKLPAIGTPSGG